MPNAHAKRVVSLIASATEIICALGARDLLVGRSHECDFPPDVRRLPFLTEPKFLTTGTSYEIDARVKAIVQEGLAVYRVCRAPLVQSWTPAEANLSPSETDAGTPNGWVQGGQDMLATSPTLPKY
jgi:hypothetical protein